MFTSRTFYRRLRGFVALTTVMVVVYLTQLPHDSKSSQISRNHLANSPDGGHGGIFDRGKVISNQLNSNVRSLNSEKLRISGNDAGVNKKKLQAKQSLGSEDRSQLTNNLDLVGNAVKVGIRNITDQGETDRVHMEVEQHVEKHSNTALSKEKCDKVCKDFRSLMHRWPPGKPRAAFYYLTKPSRLSLLNSSLNSVDRYFNARYQYPIIVFHEADLTSYHDHIRKMTKSQIYFQLIEFTVPDFLEFPIPSNIDCLSSVTYRHMCRFHAKGVYEEPIMQTLQYYWRLDDDSLLLSDVKYDVFAYMDDNSLQYGYLWRHWDAYSCVEGLWEATQAFIDEQNITTQFFRTWKKAWLYYNNFEISSTKMWFSTGYKLYIDYIDKLGGMFYTRWGDAPIHGIAVSMFIPKNQTILFRDIGYQHGWYKHKAQYNTTKA